MLLSISSLRRGCQLTFIIPTAATCDYSMMLTAPMKQASGTSGRRLTHFGTPMSCTMNMPSSCEFLGEPDTQDFINYTIQISNGLDVV